MLNILPVLPLKDPSSNIRQYRYVNIMLNTKLKPMVPKNVKLVKSLQIWYFLQIKDWLKYNCERRIIIVFVDIDCHFYKFY